MSIKIWAIQPVSSRGDFKKFLPGDLEKIETVSCYRPGLEAPMFL